MRVFSTGPVIRAGGAVRVKPVAPTVGATGVGMVGAGSRSWKALAYRPGSRGVKFVWVLVFMLTSTVRSRW